MFLASLSPTVERLQKRLSADGLACEVSFGVQQGGGEAGLLEACELAKAAGCDGVVTVGGGAVQDLGKLVRLWMAQEATDVASSSSSSVSVSVSVDALLARAASSADLILRSVPQLAVPTGFAQAEMTGLAGVARIDKAQGKAIFDAGCLVPTGVIFDPTLSASAPDWLRYGTALRCVDHAVEAATHPAADEATLELAIAGLAQVAGGLRAMTAAPSSASGTGADSLVYRGGVHAMVAFSGVGYGAGHFLENQFSARFGVHQGACSSLLMWRVLHHHRRDAASAAAQERIARALGSASSDSDGGAAAEAAAAAAAAVAGGPGASAARLVHDLCAGTPGMPVDYSDLGDGAPSPEDLAAFSDFMFEEHAETLNKHCPEPFRNAEDVLKVMLTSPRDL
jgi:alcohol dehydrogenase class IV